MDSRLHGATLKHMCDAVIWDRLLVYKYQITQRGFLGMNMRAECNRNLEERETEGARRETG